MWGKERFKQNSMTHESHSSEEPVTPISSVKYALPPSLAYISVRVRILEYLVYFTACREYLQL